jgi:hypothetical protein
MTKASALKLTIRDCLSESESPRTAPALYVMVIVMVIRAHRSPYRKLHGIRIRGSKSTTIDVMRSKETGCDLKHERITLIEIEKLRYIVLKQRRIGRRATIGDRESGTNQAAKRL